MSATSRGQHIGIVVFVSAAKIGSFRESAKYFFQKPSLFSIICRIFAVEQRHTGFSGSGGAEHISFNNDMSSY